MIHSCTLVALALAGVTLAETEKTETYYHDTVGIPLATSIKKAETELQVNNRILGGKNSLVKDHPYLVGLVISLTNGDTSVCTSSLLSSTRIITAGHCWFDGKKQAYKFVAVLGAPTLFYGGLRIETNRVVVHENYDYRSLNYDLSMAAIPAVPFNEYIKPIRLPYGQLLNYDFVGETVTAIGYGRTASAGIGNITWEQTRREANIQVVNNKLCYQVFGFWVTPRTICTKPIGNERGTCQGDSGGPLSINVNGERVLVGCTSFGKIVCDEAPHLSAFTRVTALMSWITSKLN